MILRDLLLRFQRDIPSESFHHKFMMDFTEAVRADFRFYSDTAWLNDSVSEWETGLRWDEINLGFSSEPPRLLEDVDPNVTQLYFASSDIPASDNRNGRQFGLFMADKWKAEMAQEQRDRIEAMLKEIRDRT